ncbi:hypothetical protein GCM10009682_02450 [Luedemannella flava]|uniref:Uncharacterized protein n=1 Tax=Luedemannella flava TaxID=349316 RepID=A0ABP4XLC2_9ACTN
MRRTTTFLTAVRVTSATDESFLHLKITVADPGRALKPGTEPLCAAFVAPAK